jgi:hypothetical protein
MFIQENGEIFKLEEAPKIKMDIEKMRVDYKNAKNTITEGILMEARGKSDQEENQAIVVRLEQEITAINAELGLELTLE